MARCVLPAWLSPMVVFLALLAVPGVAAEPVVPVQLELQADLYFSEAMLFSGALSFSSQLQDPVFVNTHHLGASGTLTVCPYQNGTGVVPTVLAFFGPDCPGGTPYDDPALILGDNIDLLFAGMHDVQRFPEAVLGVFTSETPHHAAFVANGTLGLRLDGDGILRFAPLNAASSIGVESEEGPVYYNGTEHVFVWETPDIVLGADGFGGTVAGDVRIVLEPAKHKAISAAFVPFTLLDVQEALLGADQRESRSNVTGVLRAYGRVPAYTNGALIGQLTGTVAGARLDDAGASLLRFDRLEGIIDGTQFIGEGSLVVAMTPSGVAFHGADVRHVPWAVPIIAWSIALVVVLLRRHEPSLAGWSVISPILALVGGWLIVDHRVLASHFGASALFANPGDPGPTLALAVFGALATAFWAFMLWWPLVVTWRRLPPDLKGIQAIGDLGLTLLWWGFLWVFPSLVMASGLLVARI